MWAKPQNNTDLFTYTKRIIEEWGHVCVVSFVLKEPPNLMKDTFFQLTLQSL